jgi:hypothetical protein
MTFQKGHPAYARKPRDPVTVAKEPPKETAAPRLPIQRFTADMVDEWLIGRLNDLWPGRPELHWRNKIADFARSNDYLLITNGEAVLCAMKLTHPVSNMPMPIEVFAFSRSARLTHDGTGNWTIPDHDGGLADLYRYARAWLRSMKAFRMVCGTCSDMTASDFGRLFGSMYLADLR